MKKRDDLERLKDKTVEYTKFFKIPSRIKIIDAVKKNKKIVIGIIIVIFLALGYYIGSPKDNKQVVLDKLEQGLETGNLRTLNSIIEVNGDSVGRKNLEPLVSYFNERKDKIDSFVNLVGSDGTTQMMDLKKKEGFLKDRYYIELKTYSLKVTSNLKGTELTLNGKKIEPGKVVNDLVPGEYTLIGRVQTGYGEINETGEISLLENTELNLDLRGDTIKINSPFKDAKVLVNGKDSGKTVSNFNTIGPLPMDGSVSLSLEKAFPWGKIVGDSVVVEKNSEINLNLNMANETLWTEVDGRLNEFYTSVFNALNEENKEEIKNATEDAKEKIYGVLEKQYLFLKNDYKLNGLTIDREKSSFTESNGEYRGTIVCDVNYTISKEIFGISGFSSTEENKKFFTKIVYKNGNWIVENVENFSL